MKVVKNKIFKNSPGSSMDKFQSMFRPSFAMAGASGGFSGSSDDFEQSGSSNDYLSIKGVKYCTNDILGKSNGLSNNVFSISGGNSESEYGHGSPTGTDGASGSGDTSISFSKPDSGGSPED